MPHLLQTEIYANPTNIFYQHGSSLNLTVNLVATCNLRRKHNPTKVHQPWVVPTTTVSINFLENIIVHIFFFSH